MSKQLHDWCTELLTKATGERVADGHTAREEEYKWHAFASAGYRNTDVVNSMIAFFCEHPEITVLDKPWWASGINKTAVKEYMKWAMKHTDKEDWYDIEVKARDVIPYIMKYRCNPESYLIECGYLNISQIIEFM